MKAAVINKYGTPVEIAEVPQPKLLADSVLIEVHAASVNPIDNIVRAGYMKDMMPIPFPYIMGYDVSGVVLEVGDRVTKFKKGDEVFSRPNTMQAGTIAEYTMVKEEELALKPANINHQEAASVPLVGLTAWQALGRQRKSSKRSENSHSCGFRRRGDPCHSNGETPGSRSCDNNECYKF